MGGEDYILSLLASVAGQGKEGGPPREEGGRQMGEYRRGKKTFVLYRQGRRPPSAKGKTRIVKGESCWKGEKVG